MRRFIILTAICMIFLSACKKSEWLTMGEYFFLENKGAVMPIWVAGNITSGTFIITNHGGPLRNSGHDFRISQGFKNLEKEYAIVYWDQRLSGMSQGDPDISSLSVDQNIEDLEKLVQLIQHKYNPNSMFMLGHSWGGTLTGGYLGRNNNQDKFKGWINVDGSIQDKFEGQAKKEWILERVDSVMEESDNKEYWQYIKDWYIENPEPVETDWQPYYYVSSLGGDVYDYEKMLKERPVPYKDLVFSSPFTFAFYWTQHYSLDALSWINGYDVSTEVSNIYIPSLLLWGRHDGIVPPSVGEFTYSLLQTDTMNKKMIVMDKCGHGPFNEYQEEFYLIVRDFIEEYK